jgi:protein-S-isoprenylcysteine O-methyltransferase Ste14
VPVGPAYSHAPGLHLAFLLSYAGWLLIEIAIWSRDRAKAKGWRKDRYSMLAIAASVAIGITLAFNLVQFRWARIAAPPELLVGIALVLIWSGIAFRLWAVRTLGRFFRVTVIIQDDHRLVDTGPYARLRNPSYTGALVTMIGVGLAIGNWLSLAAIVLIPMLGFGWRIRVEEASLAARFGADYLLYRSRRWALIPPIW